MDSVSPLLVDTSCESISEMPLQPLAVYDPMSARVVFRTTMPLYLTPQEGPSPIVDYKSSWEPVVDWSVNWTLKVPPSS